MWRRDRGNRPRGAGEAGRNSAALGLSEFSRGKGEIATDRLQVCGQEARSAQPVPLPQVSRADIKVSTCWAVMGKLRGKSLSKLF